MGNPLKSIEIANGVSFNTIIDKRFKTNRISINFVTELKNETVTVNALIPQLLKKGYVGCENYTELNRKLEELYGAYINADVHKKGDYQILTLCITGIDDRFSLENESIIQKTSDILCNMALKPIIEDGGFSKQYVELEKKSLIDSIDAELNEKRVYSINSAIQLMCKEEPYGLPMHGFKDRVLEITPQSAKQQYDNILETARIEIMFTGCGDDTGAINVFTKAFQSLNREYSVIPPILAHIPAQTVTEEIENMPVSQSKMVLGFSAQVTSKDMLAPAMRLMVAVLGGTPSAKLFVNVREKLSLCYYCAAHYDISKGIITIDSGVENQNIQKAREEILIQLDLMKKGDFTDDEIGNATLSLKNAFSSVYEHASSIEGFYLGQILSGMLSSPDAEKLKLDSITRQEIIDAANKVTLDTVYILTANEVK
ncbi:MAG: insulinase family protein, partial [Oscillospiraceae bacterium]